MFEHEEPQEGVKVQSWHHEKCPEGTWFKAFLAAKPFGVQTHWIGRTVPCWSILTKKQLECPHCKPGSTLEWKGYVRLFRDDNRHVFVIVGEEQRETLRKIEHYTPVHVARSKGKGNGIAIKEDTWSTKRWVPPAGYQGVPDIRPKLLTVWKEPRLTDFFAVHGMSENTAAAAELPRTTGDPPQPSPSVVDAYKNASPEMQAIVVEQHRQRAKKRGQEGPVSIDEVIGTAMSKQPSVRDAQLNGVHGK